MECCEREYILMEIDGTLETKFYLVQYPVRFRIKNRPWAVEFLEYIQWPPSRIALISGSTIKILNFHAALRLLICLLSWHWPEETQVRCPWYTWCAEPQVDLRDQTIFSDPVSSAYKSSVICFLSNKSLTLGIFFSA